MKQSRLESIADSTFTQLNLQDQAYLLGGASTEVATIPITDPLPHGTPDSIKDIVNDDL
ncbi:MAG TPA: hypothetical protein VI756_08370 [Blastocatellia bacterium]